jgi:hypothetical protein
LQLPPHLQAEPQPHFPPQQEDIFFREIIEVWKRFSLGIEFKRFIENSKAKEYRFLHVGSVQVAVKPLTRLGINASVLLCLRDARFINFRISILGMIQSSLFNGPIHFDVFPNLTISFDDINILKALTLNVLISGYDMEEGSRPLAIIYRIYY